MSSTQLTFVGECGCRVSSQCVPHCSSAKGCSNTDLLSMFGSLIRLTVGDYGILWQSFGYCHGKDGPSKFATGLPLARCSLGNVTQAVTGTDFGKLV